MQNRRNRAVRCADIILSGLTRALLRVIALLPLAVSQAIGRLIGRWFYWFDTRAAKVTATNIRLCFPGLSPDAQRRLVKESLMQTGQMMMECPAAWLGSLERIRSWFCEIRGEPLIDAGVASNRGLIIILPHIGNWELFNAYCAWRSPAKGHVKYTGLYAPPSKVWMQGIMSEIRGRFGNELVPTTTSGLVRLYRCMEDGAVAVILPDQVPARGEFAPFFGHDCLTDRLISRLIKRTRPLVVCCVIERLPQARGFRVVFSEADPDIYADDLSVSLRGLNKCVEQCIEQAPSQYQWEYKRFKRRPAGERRVYNYKNKLVTYHPAVHRRDKRTGSGS